MSDRLLCRIGVHSRYLDMALFNKAWRCNLCTRLDKGPAYEALVAERKRNDAMTTEEFLMAAQYAPTWLGL